MKTHKTFSGMREAIERTIAELRANPPDNDRDYKRQGKAVDALLAECNALWRNPADAEEAAALKGRLLEAWNPVA